ncbi:sigma factor, partial [Bacteriovorax sp. DB6_IX]|uniref:sigma factor n=1 Tax=Bacteriovorax sp. DB6_IX TaxID=1353530 RepID=UPI00038A00AA
MFDKKRSKWCEIIEKARDNNDLDSLFKSVKNDIYRLAPSTFSLLDPADQEDLLQEIYIALFKNINSFDADLGCRSWL